MQISKETNHTIQLFPVSNLAKVIVGESVLELLISIQRATALDRAIQEVRLELEELRAGRQREKSTLEFLDDLARRIGLDRDWRETYDENVAKQLERRRLLAPAQPCVLPPDFYAPRPDPLGFMKWARHHSRGGRARNERFMDRRGYVDNPELRSSNDEIRNAAWANLGPFNTPIYPVRVTEADLLLREKSERRCCVCQKSLADKRLNAAYCSDRCRMRDVRANATRSLYMEKE